MTEIKLCPFIPRTAKTFPPNANQTKYLVILKLNPNWYFIISFIVGLNLFFPLAPPPHWKREHSSLHQQYRRQETLPAHLFALKHHRSILRLRLLWCTGYRQFNSCPHTCSWHLFLGQPPSDRKSPKRPEDWIWWLLPDPVRKVGSHGNGCYILELHL